MNRMKYVTRSLFALIGLFTVITAQFSTAFAQGTAFTYQGRLNNNGSPAGGIYNFQFTLYATNQSGSVIAGPLTNSAVTVTNGLFTTIIDFGPDVFTGTSYWLDIAVSTNGNGTFTELAPRQPVTPAPYAIMANSASNLLGALSTAQLTGTLPATNLSGTVPSANLSGTYGNAVSFDNGADSFDGTFIGQFVGSSFLGGSFNGQFFGDGTGLINLNASQFTVGTISPARLPNNVAFLNSNQTFTAQNIFTQPIGLGNPNPSPGYQIDALANQSNVRMVSTNTGNGAVLELNNQSSYPGEYLGAINFNDTNNYYPGQIGYIAENPTNVYYDYFEFRVAGSVGLTIQADPRGEQAASLIGGSPANSIVSGSAGDAIVGGGYPGFGNTISTNTYGVFIGAGSGNVGGPFVDDSVIAGGYGNTVQSSDSAVGGGAYNFISTNSQYAVVSGGNYNTNAAYASVIAGGVQNQIQSAGNDSFIGAGNANIIQSNSVNSVIGGGVGNTILSAATESMIGGGFYNVIGATNFGEFIGGGQGNLIDSYDTIATIGGGWGNRIEGNYFYYSGNYTIGSTIAGGIINLIDTNNYADAIGGGWDNIIQSNVNESYIGGGVQNTVQSNAYEAVISGGFLNQVANIAATVPGGYKNFATGAGSFAAGTQAQATNNGSFVLADDEFTNFYSTTTNQLSARFTGGIRFVTAGAGMTLDGQPILSSASGAPSSGSANYIQNQSASPQAASFNISGNGTAGGTLSANSLTITNQFRVAGAGIGTSTAAFIVVSASTNISYSNAVRVNNPLCNGRSNAILLVAHNVSAQTSFGYNDHPIGVWYDGSYWNILNEDVANMATNIAFNVLVINP
jgi:hypothetical protein